jgi:hypothetical protein
MKVIMALFSLFLSGCIAVFPHPVSPSVRAIVAGRSVVIEPYDISFSLPSSWLQWYQQFGNNIYASKRELRRSRYGEGAWNFDYTRIVNALLPYDRCVLHAGSDGWERRSPGSGRLQIRVYVGNFDLGEIGKDVKNDGLRIARSLGKNAAVSSGQLAGWPRISLSYYAWYGDHGANARIDFCARQFADTSLLVVLMYADYPPYQLDEAKSILLSVQSGHLPAGDGA